MSTNQNLYYVGLGSSSESSFNSKVSKSTPSCSALCTPCIYYLLSMVDKLRAGTHLGYHCHPVATGQCHESLEMIASLIATKVEKTPMTKNSTIALEASKEFLDTF